LGSLYERDCYLMILMVPLESQTTGPQTNNEPLVDLPYFDVKFKSLLYNQNQGVEAFLVGKGSGWNGCVYGMAAFQKCLILLWPYQPARTFLHFIQISYTSLTFDIIMIISCTSFHSQNLAIQ